MSDRSNPDPPFPISMTPLLPASFILKDEGHARWKYRKGNKQVSADVHGRYAANRTGVRLDSVLRHIGIGGLPYFTARYALLGEHRYDSAGLVAQEELLRRTLGTLSPGTASPAQTQRAAPFSG